jgi:hypothetical protein
MRAGDLIATLPIPHGEVRLRSGPEFYASDKSQLIALDTC